MGIQLCNEIPASMKNEVYKVKVACTKRKLLACECDCKSGGKDKERITCVHCLPVCLQLSLLLMDGLAEHILLTLSEQWNEGLEKKIDEMCELDNVKKSIQTLVVAAKGINEKTEYLRDSQISKILENFAVGTERRKTMINTISPDPRLLCPIKELKKKSVCKKLAERTKCIEKKENMRKSMHKQIIVISWKNLHQTTSRSFVC
jgi:hypothetical protein